MQKLTKILREYWIIKKSGLFDPIYYLSNHPDVRKADLDPIYHYINYGWKEGRNPSKEFDTDYYLKENSDVKTQNINPLIHYLLYGKREHRSPNFVSSGFSAQNIVQTSTSDINKPFEMQNWGILTTHHTKFVARLLSAELEKYVNSVEIITAELNNYHLDRYIVICPQMFTKLPDRSRSIAFQMEQSTSSRWFTQEYLDLLNSFPIIFDYSLENIKFLADRGIKYPKIYYMPIGALTDNENRPLDKKVTHKILFYGDYKGSPRRIRMLSEIEKYYPVKIVSELFDSEMDEMILSSQIVLNIHYYTDSLLETPRIYQCLSLGTPVISEVSKDADEYEDLSDVVTFFNEEDINDLLIKIEKFLDNPIEKNLIEASNEKSSDRFNFMFERFLIGEGYLGKDHVNDLPAFQFKSNEVVLSLPETTERREAYNQKTPARSQFFNGIRVRPGWIGCALSYKYLARSALENEMQNLLIIEDDVELFSNHHENLEIISEYLKLNTNWDVFSGIIADLNKDCRIIDVDHCRGIQFVTLDKMVSTVFNIYSHKALLRMALWNPYNLDVNTNTVDRYLESYPNFRIITTLPFLVGHRENEFSTIWEIQNTSYNEMIGNSEVLLADKVQHFINQRRSNQSSSSKH